MAKTTAVYIVLPDISQHKRIDIYIGYVYNIGVNNTNKKDALNHISHNHRLKPSKLVLFALVLVLFAGVLLAMLERTHVTDFVKTSDKSTTTSGPTKAQQDQQAKTDAQAKQDYLDSIAKSNASSDTNTPSDTGSQTSVSGSLAVSASQSGSSVTVLTQIQGITAGSCRLVVTNGAISVSQNAQIIYQPEFSSCAGFSVPISGIGSGSWNISVTATPDTGTPITKTIVLEVK